MQLKYGTRLEPKISWWGILLVLLFGISFFIGFSLLIKEICKAIN